MRENVTFADRSMTVQGQRFHLTDWGSADAPTVLFLHGFTGHARTWDHEAAALAGRFRIIALDQRGHGDSDPAPDGDYTLTALTGDIAAVVDRSEEHTSELQSQSNLVCRLLLEKKKTIDAISRPRPL